VPVSPVQCYGYVGQQRRRGHCLARSIDQLRCPLRRAHLRLGIRQRLIAARGTHATWHQQRSPSRLQGTLPLATASGAWPAAPCRTATTHPHVVDSRSGRIEDERPPPPTWCMRAFVPHVPTSSPRHASTGQEQEEATTTLRRAQACSGCRASCRERREEPRRQMPLAHGREDGGRLRRTNYGGHSRHRVDQC